MTEKDENGGDCGDDDEWGDLITTPNRLISDDFLVLKAENIGNDEEKEGKLEDQEQESRVCSDVVEDISVSVSSSPATAWSQFLTIPSGISPTSLLELDSPIMLPNSQASPTTGTLPYPPLNHEILGMNSAVEDRISDNGSFTYPSHGGSLLWPCIPDLQNQNSAMQPTIPSEFSGTLSKERVTKGRPTELEGFKAVKSTIRNANNAATIKSTEGDHTKRHLLDGYPKETTQATMRNSEDGYNWRKYGQKQVKGSEYPRSYYKCTHPNCQVKKKVERSRDGHITEIIYKGAHNHQGHRNVIGSPASFSDSGSYIKIEEGEVWGNNNIGTRQDWTPDGMELSSSTSVVTDNSDIISPTQGKSMGIFESAGNPELSSSNGNCEFNEEDGTNVGMLSPGDDADEDKSDLKRRKKGNFLLETSLVSRAMREPRVVVQIESDVDILDDGYRWRKYGQKVVKGNPNPRSYYKCTSAGCPVRKHVERASDDLKSVLTTYEGKHNHEVPVSRNSSHATMDVGSASNTPNSLSLPRISNVPKSEPQVQDLPLRYARKLTNEYIPSNFVGNFDPEPTKFEASSIYQTKYVPFQSPISFGSVLPDYPLSLPMTIPPSGHMVHNGFGFNNNGKRTHEAQSQSFIQNNGRFIKPKVEQDDGFYENVLRVPDRVNDASSASRISYYGFCNFGYLGQLTCTDWMPLATTNGVESSKVNLRGVNEPNRVKY
ncbi:probable WRKY transcription factor 34 [Cynara cardunculus var. scolymus]|uniref:probable WRKY transcription factor 34 n=1 Tax=Cynara cardunculus var. scolymus TaxID=59895 RepID=UPI000D62E423|nr:probable WRKY transcription factor 34 [Cynara cardunculus var. scolymus]